MANESSDIIALPIANIQHDFQNVIFDVRDGVVESEDIWLSCYKIGSQSVHGKVSVQLGERIDEGSGPRPVELISRDGVYLGRAEKGNYLASCDDLSISQTLMRVPRYVVRDPDSTLKVALGYENGSIRRLPLRLTQGSTESDDRPPTPLTYTPHLSGTSVEVLSYFPSSRVLLSAGADFMLHVLDADPGLTAAPKPVRSLKGHIRPVTGLAIIERGRNVLSGARDGTLRLWDVSEGKQVRVMGSQKYSPINAISLGHAPPSENTNTPESDPRETGTAGKRVFVALQSGDFECVDLGTKASIFHSSSVQNYERHGPLTAIADDSDSNLLATGSAKGVITAFDTRRLNAALCAFQRNSAGIEGLGFVPQGTAGGSSEEADSRDPDLAIATADGLPYVASIRPNGPEVRSELACGGECEPIRALTVDSRGGIWLAGDEGVVRMY